jgi:hypothetical protein
MVCKSTFNSIPKQEKKKTSEKQNDRKWQLKEWQERHNMDPRSDESFYFIAVPQISLSYINTRIWRESLCGTLFHGLLWS